KWARHNIQVNAIAPGWFPTHMSDWVIEHKKDYLLSHIPARRFGADHDLKGAAVFLASDASAYVSGHVLVVDGGQSACLLGHHEYSANAGALPPLLAPAASCMD